MKSINRILFFFFILLLMLVGCENNSGIVAPTETNIVGDWEAVGITLSTSEGVFMLSKENQYIKFKVNGIFQMMTPENSTTNSEEGFWNIEEENLLLSTEKWKAGYKYSLTTNSLNIQLSKSISIHYTR